LDTDKPLLNSNMDSR